MVTVRDTLAKRNAGGPQFGYIPQRILVEVDGDSPISKIARDDDPFSGERLDTLPVGDTVITEVQSQLEELDFNTKALKNTGVIVAEAERLTTVVKNIKSYADTFSNKVLNEIDKLESRVRNGSDRTIIDAFRPGLFNFNDPEARDLEARLRNELLGDLHNPITSAIEELTGVLSVEVSYSMNTPGPKNLGVDPFDSEHEVVGESDLPDLGDINEKIGVKSAWQVDSGENAVVAIFDTSFSEKLVKSDRVIDTFHGDDVDSAYSAPEEGHGTMTAYSAAGNVEDVDSELSDEIDYNGVAKDADLLLARLSDSSGAMVYVEEAWDWLAGWIKSLDRPVISNHSYGVPMCNGFGQGLCNSIVTNMAAALSKRSDHQAFYAAGNEAQYCGHRLSGITNGITGVNSVSEVMAVAAFRSDTDGAQLYSSHGFGSCQDRLGQEDPKPDVGTMIPSIVPYGAGQKDMSSSSGGSQAGTSEASPITAGAAALVASVTGTADKSIIESVLEGTATLPRTTQVNAIKGVDARYGNGQIQVDEAVRRAKVFDEEEPPSAVFTYEPGRPTAGDEVTFDASGSTDPNENIEQFEWDFGDGETATGETVTHTFEDHGVNTVILRVTDSFGNEDTYSAEVDVAAEPEAAFAVGADSVLEEETITFDASESTDPDGDITGYAWDFGDGDTATGEVVEHSYDESGSYTCTLIVEDSLGNTDTASTSIRVSAAPTPMFTYAPEDPLMNEEVLFDATESSDPNEDIVRYEWDFGDGVVAQGPTMTHTFESPGAYDVVLTVVDSMGNERSTSETVNVTASPTADFTVSPVAPTTSDAVTLDANPSTDPENNIESYTWDLGTGDTKDGRVVQTVYESAGEYQVMLTVEDQVGNVDSVTKTITVSETSGRDSSGDESEQDGDDGSSDEGGSSNGDSDAGGTGDNDSESS